MGKEQELDMMPLLRSPLVVAPFEDRTEGSGFQVEVGVGRAQVFPNSRVARAERAGNQVRMRQVTSVHVENGALNVYAATEEEHSALRLDEATLVFVASRKGLSNDHTARHPADRPMEHTAVIPVIAGSVSPETAAQNAEQEERERVTLVGRIGHKPQFRTTPKGTLVGSFSLGVHPEPGQTEWHKVVTFGKRAEKLQESGLSKGDEVEVVGYPHERERRNQKTGEVKTVTELYAAVVKRARDGE